MNITHNNFIWEKAKGWKVKINGKWLIDFTSSIFTQNFGHSNPKVVKAIKKQLKKCTHAYGYETEVKTEFIEKLKDITGYPNVLLFSTGAEAIEACIKIMLHNGYECIGIKGAMHGRTLGAEALVGKRNLPGIWTMDSIMDIPEGTKNKAIFIEGYRGYDCRQITVDEWFYLDLLKENNKLVFDEIQSGMFRALNLFVSVPGGSDFPSVDSFASPDILVLGKSLGGGLPLSAVVFKDGFNLEGLELTSTHEGQPLQMVAGLAVLDEVKKYLDPDHLYGFVTMQKFFKNNIAKKYECNYSGMVAAVKVDDEEKVYKYCFDHGLLVVKTGKGWIKVAPPITISHTDLMKGLHILEESCR